MPRDAKIALLAILAEPVVWGRAAMGQQEGTTALQGAGNCLLGVCAHGMEVESFGNEHFQIKKSNLF